MRRIRAAYLLLALVTIGIGLLVHMRGEALGPVGRDFIGDALWAVMIVWWVSALVSRALLTTRGIVAFAICAGVELSQLYHSSALDAIRATQLGHLILGSGFDARDLVAYGFGIAAAAILDQTLIRRR
ncbi:MAG: DUF2809 domain-containing protein [Gemmatimonadales bacterium]